VVVSVAQVIDLTTGSRRDDVTASVGRLCVSESGRYAAVVDYERQHAVTVHSLDGLLRQVVEEDVESGVDRRCPNYVEVVVQPQAEPPQTCGNGVDVASGPPESEMTIEEFDQRCKRPPPTPVRIYCVCSRNLRQ